MALGIQFFHHIEHPLLQTQAILGHNLFGRPVPTSIVQLWVPRVELHLFYNTIVFIPMVIAMYYHMFPPSPDTATSNAPAHGTGRQPPPFEASRRSQQLPHGQMCGRGACRKCSIVVVCGVLGFAGCRPSRPRRVRRRRRLDLTFDGR